MHRTNLYLTAAQERALDARARAAGTSRAAVVREILDRDLALVSTIDDETAAGFEDVGRSYFAAVADLFDDDPDLRIDR